MQTPEEIRTRFEQTLDLIDFTTRMYRQTLRRRFPDETDDQIQVRINAWFQERPGAELGDAEGIPGRIGP